MISQCTSSQQLSSGELRSKIFEKFKAKGIMDTVKTQLRNHLALELNGDMYKKKIIEENSIDGSLFLKLSNELIIEHFKQCSYEYSLSVFLSETVASPNKHFSLVEILQLLQIREGSKLYEKLILLQENNKSVKSFLWSFLLHVAQANGYDKRDNAVQTDLCIDKGSLVDKLAEIEKTQLRKHLRDIENDAQSVEGKMLMYQRKYEAQKQAELQAQMERFRMSELANMRMEEREKYVKEINRIKTKYDEETRGKMKELNKLEDEIKEKSQRQAKLLEADAYEKRQEILKEMQTLKQREGEMKETHNKALKMIEIEEEKLKNRNEQLRFKEQSLKELENRFQEKIEAEILKVKFEMQKENKNQIDSLNERELSLREEMVSFQAQKEVILKSKNDTEATKQQNQKLQILLMTAQQELSNVKERYQEQQMKQSKYEGLQQENIDLKKELQHVRREADGIISQKTQRKKELERQVKDLLDKLKKKDNGAQGSILMDIETHRRVADELREKCKELQHKHQLEVSKNAELRKSYNDLLLYQKEMVREIDELKSNLLKANQDREKLLFREKEREIFRSVDSGRRTLEFSHKPQSITSTKPISERHQSASNSLNQHYEKTNLLWKSGETLKKLEAEAEEYEKSYKKFLERQKSYKSPSRVHFDTFVQKHSPETFTEVSSLPATTMAETLHLSRLMPDRSIISFQRLPEKFHQLSKEFVVDNLKRDDIKEVSQKSLSQPLSSTQTIEAIEAPSFGLSRVVNNDTEFRVPPLQSNGKEASRNQDYGNIAEYPTKKSKSNGIAEKERYTPGATTFASPPQNNFHALTQHPTPFMTGDSLTQYPLLDSKTLSQYPLLDSNLKTPLPREATLKTPGTKKLETLTEQSILTTENDDVGVSVKSTQKSERTNSVETEFNLNEATIGTFESPAGVMSNQPEVFLNPDEYSTRDTQQPSDNMEDNNFSNKNEVNPSGMSRSTVTSTQQNEENNSQSSSTHKGEMKPDEFNNSLSEGELAESTPANDLMTEYMKMVIQKRDQEELGHKNNIKNTAISVSNAQNESMVDDIPISEDESVRKDSEKSSEYEW